MNIKCIYELGLMIFCCTSISMEQEQLNLAREKFEWKKEYQRVQLAIEVYKLADKINWSIDLQNKLHDITINQRVVFEAQRIINNFFCNGQSTPPSPNKLSQYKQDSPMFPRSASFSGSDRLLEPLEQGYHTD
ncbi:MAG TPA: hypothetical protein PLU71_01775 [Candidatus Dependentiae bacterium]|nr:hypothetical protein [Candidatus Dependentiae bacterium]HRQ62560.1 hypothetical protein [Candidatus Dependentiae bacterium]